jgi:ferredoxin--NADP+ reductase
MLAELLARGHRGRIAVLTCVRRRADLGYLETHRALEARYANYRYVPLTTREPENVDPSCPGFVGRQYLQDYVASGRLERETGIGLVPGRTHFYLCGNPQMIGLPHHAADGSHSYPRPVGMVETLERLGFELDSPGRPGTIHAEQYWAASEGQHMAGSIPESQ